MKSIQLTGPYVFGVKESHPRIAALAVGLELASGPLIAEAEQLRAGGMLQTAAQTDEFFVAGFTDATAIYSDLPQADPLREIAAVAASNVLFGIDPGVDDGNT